MPSNEKFLPTGMSTLRFRATPDKADIIQNLVISEDGTLKAMTGPTLYEPREVFGTATPLDLDRVHAIWHGYFNGGQKEALFIHAGNKLYCHWGAKKTWVPLMAASRSGLVNSNGAPRPLSNDSETVSGFIPFNNGVVFYDGKGPPLFINNQLYCDFLGFADIPSAPVVRGPESSDQGDAATDGEGTFGYSRWGGLGTPGDRLNGEDSHILKGSWSYKCQYESYQGDLSALSSVSADIQYGPKKAKAVSKSARVLLKQSWDGYGGEGILASPGTTVKDLTKGTAVIVPDSVPLNTKFIRVLRTKDLRRNETDYYMAWKVPSAGSVLHDWVFDSSLTIKAVDAYPIPSFSAACVFNGSLVILDKSDVRMSEPGFPGTFERSKRLTITAEGRQGTAVFSIGRSLFASTDTSIVDCTDFAQPITVSRTIGIAGPNCWCFVPGSGIVFVSRQGVYSLSRTTKGGSEINKLSGDIENMWRTKINNGKLRTSVIWYSRKHNELRIAVAKKGQTSNTLILAYSNGGWRKYDLGLEVNCFAYAGDLELVGGTDNRSMSGNYTADDVYVLEKETKVYTPPARKVIYESDYEPIDESLGAVRGKVIDLYLCFAETHAAEIATVKLFSNYETDPDETFTARLDDVYGNDPERKAAWDQSVLGTDRLQERRIVWRKVRAAIRDVQRFKFRVETTYPNGPELVAAMYEFNILAAAGAREPDIQDT